jgi:hypothetical protein
MSAIYLFRQLSKGFNRSSVLSALSNRLKSLWIAKLADLKDSDLSKWRMTLRLITRLTRLTAQISTVAQWSYRKLVRKLPVKAAAAAVVASVAAAVVVAAEAADTAAAVEAVEAAIAVAEAADTAAVEAAIAVVAAATVGNCWFTSV